MALVPSSVSLQPRRLVRYSMLLSLRSQEHRSTVSSSTNLDGSRASGVYDVYQVTNTSSFRSDSDCDMFIMVQQQQWPNFIDVLPGAKRRIFRSEEDRNVMQASWTLQSKEQADEMKAIGDEIIIPYRKKLMPKSIRFEGSLVATVDNDN